MRVMQIIPNLGLGGAEKMVIQLSAELKSRGVDVRITSLFAREENANSQYIQENNIDIRYLDKKMGLDIGVVRHISDEIKDFKPVVLHSHRYCIKYLTPYIFTRPKQVVHTVHNLASREVGKLDQRVHNLAFKRGVTPVAIAERIRESLREVYGLEESRIPLIPNGINLRPFDHDNDIRDEWREREGIPAEDTVFVCVGRLTRQKNHNMLLDAFRKVVDRLNNCLLLIVGEGELRSEIYNKVEELNLQAHVKLLGLRSDIPEVLAGSDVFVMSSDWEGNPLSVMEAMAAGRSVIATAVGGIPEIISTGETGLLVSPQQPRELTEAMLTLAQDNEFRRVTGRRAKAYAQQFSAEVMAERYISLYEKIVQS